MRGSPTTRTGGFSFTFAQLVLTPLVAVGVWMLLDGIQSVAATIARATLVVWMVFFSAFDAIAGIAVGVLTRYAAPQVLFGISCFVPTGARD